MPLGYDRRQVTGGAVRKGFCICVSLLMLVAAGAAAPQRGAEGSPDQYFGTWTGTWEGAGSTGGFEITLEKGKDGAPAGRVSVTGEPTYKATLKTLSLENRKLTATYDFPPDESMEVALTATFDGQTATGTWSAVQKAGSREVVSGTWKVGKK
jgi:hypothetical protein